MTVSSHEKRNDCSIIFTWYNYEYMNRDSGVLVLPLSLCIGDVDSKPLRYGVELMVRLLQECMYILDQYINP
jgi:hypothetical protein